MSGDRVTVENSIVAQNVQGVSCTSCAILSTTFQSNREYGAELRGGFANDCIARNNSVGFRMMGGSPAVARSTIEDNDVGMYQKFSYYCSDHYSNPAMVTNCAILRNRIGIYSPGSSSTCCEMSGNRIANNREAGVSLSYWSRISLKNNTFSGSPVCFSASETSSGDVRDNVFDNCSTAAFETTSCPMSFTCNTVRNCGKGIRIGGPVSGNLFENNKGPAITIQAQLDAHDNSFINNGPVDVLQTTSAQCDFSCNYWGTTNADEVAARIVDFVSNPSLGFVNVSSLLAVPPALSCLRQLTPTSTQPPFSATSVAPVWVPAGMTLANSSRNNVVWDAAHSPYYVSRTVGVIEGTTLTIEAGVTVVFERNAALIVRGRLEVSRHGARLCHIRTVPKRDALCIPREAVGGNLATARSGYCRVPIRKHHASADGRVRRSCDG